MTDYAACTDEELIPLIKARDERAEEELFTRYKKPVRRKARTFFLLGADQEDVIQEGMIGLYKAVCDFDPDRGTPFGAFANLCIERQIMIAVRNANSKKNEPLNKYISISQSFDDGESERSLTLLDKVAAAETAEPEAILIKRETYKPLNWVLTKGLTDLESRALDLYLDGFSYKQIAERLGRGTKSIDNAIRRVKLKLEESLRHISETDAKS